MALEVLAGHKFLTNGLRSKSWVEFAVAGAPQFDFIFTGCDNAAGECCPVWPGKPMTAHWGIEDPAAVDGTNAEKRIAFTTALRSMKLRIAAFAARPLESFEKMSLIAKLLEIGQLEGSTNKRPDVA